MPPACSTCHVHSAPYDAAGRLGTTSVIDAVRMNSRPLHSRIPSPSFPQELDEIASKPFAVVFFNYRGADGNAAGKADYSRIYTVLELYQKKLDHKFDRNLTKIVIVHPSYSLKIALRFFAPFVDDSLPEKAWPSRPPVSAMPCVSKPCMTDRRSNSRNRWRTSTQWSSMSCSASRLIAYNTKSGLFRLPRSLPSSCLAPEGPDLSNPPSPNSQEDSILEGEEDRANRDAYITMPGDSKDGDYEEYLTAAATVLQESWRDHAEAATPSWPGWPALFLTPSMPRSGGP